MKDKCKNCKIILYYWNHINECTKKYLEDKNIHEFWTFDSNDAKRYMINYNSQFYTKNIKLDKDNLEYDVLFLGRAKNRKGMILNLAEELKENGINSKNIIIENEKDFVPYEDYLKLLVKTKTILDIVDGNQSGLTLRCMESLFFSKKLITNNLDIVNYNFYNPNNILVLDENNINIPKEFIDSPYESLPKEIYEKYSLKNWVKQLLEIE